MKTTRVNDARSLIEKISFDHNYRSELIDVDPILLDEIRATKRVYVPVTLYQEEGSDVYHCPAGRARVLVIKKLMTEGIEVKLPALIHVCKRLPVSEIRALSRSDNRERKKSLVDRMLKVKSILDADPSIKKVAIGKKIGVDEKAVRVAVRCLPRLDEIASLIDVSDRQIVEAVRQADDDESLLSAISRVAAEKKKAVEVALKISNEKKQQATARRASSAAKKQERERALASLREYYLSNEAVPAPVKDVLDAFF
jgi:hypothetical protein